MIGSQLQRILSKYLKIRRGATKFVIRFLVVKPKPGRLQARFALRE